MQCRNVTSHSNERPSLKHFVICLLDPNYNFALGKPTAQSSQRRGFVSSFAVDGDKTKHISKCTHTEEGTQNWWRVDFGEEIPVTRVVITNRDQSEGRLGDFEIKIGNSLLKEGTLNPKCGDRHSVGQGLTETFICSPPITGQYLLIQSRLTDVLTICELEVYTG